MEILGFLLALFQVMIVLGVFEKMEPPTLIKKEEDSNTENALKQKYRPCPACNTNSSDLLIKKKDFLKRKKQGCYNCGGTGKVKTV